MKKLFSMFCLMSGLVACVSALTSCSDDNDGPSLPTYAQEAAKYTVTSGSQDIKSIELCANGEYIIVSDYSGSLQPVLPGGGYEPSLKVGNFTINADGTLNLVGYGTMKINSSSSLTVTPQDAAAMTLAVSKVTAMAATDVNMNLSRTWTASQFGMALSVGSATTYTRIGSLSEMLDVARGFFSAYGSATGEGMLPEANIKKFVENMKEDMPVEVVITRSGTMLWTMNDGSYELYDWRWRSEANKVIETAYVTIGNTDGLNYDTRMIVDVNSSQLLLHQLQVENAGETPEITTTYTWGFSAK